MMSLRVAPTDIPQLSIDHSYTKSNWQYIPLNLPIQIMNSCQISLESYKFLREIRQFLVLLVKTPQTHGNSNIAKWIERIETIRKPVSRKEVKEEFTFREPCNLLRSLVDS